MSTHAVSIPAREVRIGDQWPAINPTKTVVSTFNPLGGKSQVAVKFDDGTVWTYHHAKKVHFARGE